MDTLLTHYDAVIAAVIGLVTGAGIALAAVAPLTPTDVDDRAASWLQKKLLPILKSLRR